MVVKQKEKGKLNVTGCDPRDQSTTWWPVRNTKQHKNVTTFPLLWCNVTSRSWEANLSTANAQVLINQIGLIGQQPNIRCVYSQVTFRTAQNNYRSYYRVFLLTPKRAQDTFVAQIAFLHGISRDNCGAQNSEKETYFIWKEHHKVCSIPDIKYSYPTGSVFFIWS
jgi:hypothetical protein